MLIVGIKEMKYSLSKQIDTLLPKESKWENPYGKVDAFLTLEYILEKYPSLMPLIFLN